MNVPFKWMWPEVTFGVSCAGGGIKHFLEIGIKTKFLHLFRCLF